MEASLAVPFDVRVVAPEPALAVAHEHPLVGRDDLLVPGLLDASPRLDPGESFPVHVFDEAGHPVDTILDRAREVRRPRHALRARDHQQVREAVGQETVGGRRPLAPDVPEAYPVDPPDVDLVEGTDDDVEARREHDQVEIVVLGGRLDARSREAFDRGLREVDQVDVVAVVGLEVVRLEGQALDTEAVVLRDQLFGDFGIVDALADPVGDVVGHLPVGFFFEEDLGEVARQEREAGRVVERVPTCTSLFGRQVVEPTPIRKMDEASDRPLAVFEDLIVVGADLHHLFVGDRRVAERRAPVRAPLEDEELVDLVRDLGDHLDPGRPRPDHADAAAGERDLFLGPVIGVERVALVLLHPRVSGRSRRGQGTEGGDHEVRGVDLAALEVDPPRPIGLVPRHRGDPRFEAHVAAQVEFVRDEVQVPEVLRLGREALLPVPLFEQLLRERVAVGVALRIEAAAGIPVAVPGTTEVVVGFEQDRVETEVGQPLDLIDAGDPGPDDEVVVVLRFAHAESIVAHPPRLRSARRRREVIRVTRQRESCSAIPDGPNESGALLEPAWRACPRRRYSEHPDRDWKPDDRCEPVRPARPPR